MLRTRISHHLLLGLLLAFGALLGLLSTLIRQTPPQAHSITITARKYGYEPSILRVNRGDRLHIRLVAADVTHGFYLEGYDLDAKARPQNPTFWIRHPSAGRDARVGSEYQEIQEIDFVASRAGKFHYRCSITCGSMHPFMQGELIVSPNYLYSASVGLSLALAAGMLIILRVSAGGRQ